MTDEELAIKLYELQPYEMYEDGAFRKVLFHETEKHTQGMCLMIAKYVQSLILEDRKRICAQLIKIRDMKKDLDGNIRISWGEIKNAIEETLKLAGLEA